MKRHARPMPKLTAFALCAAALLGAAAARADGGDECFDRRPKTPAERQAALDILAALKNALPKPPAGWQLVDTTEPRRPPDTLYKTPGCTEPHSLKAQYRNDANALAAAQGMAASTGRMEALMEAMQAAIAKGDAKRINELNAELAQLQSGSGGGGGGAGGSMLAIHIEVNQRGVAGPDGSARPLALPGVPLAFAWGSGATTRVALYLGQSWQPQGKGAAMRVRREISNADAQMMVVRLDGESAEAFAKLVNVAALKAVLK